MVKPRIPTQETPAIVTYADKFVHNFVGSQPGKFNHNFLRAQSEEQAEEWDQVVVEIREDLHRLARSLELTPLNMYATGQ